MVFFKEQNGMIIRGVNKPPPPLCKLVEQSDDDTTTGKYLKDFRVCKTCGEWHQALHSIGTLQCRFHPLPFNRDCESEFHRKGVWPCCGVSPDPRDPEFDAKFVKGCTAKDHCPINSFPAPLQVHEADWPSLLTQSIYKEIDMFQQSSSGMNEWEKIVQKLHYKGIRMNLKNDSFYLSRIDDYMVEERTKHKYYKNKKLSKCIKIRILRGEDVVSFHELIVEIDKTIRDVFIKHFSFRLHPSFNIRDETDRTHNDTKLVSELDEALNFTFELPVVY